MKITNMKTKHNTEPLEHYEYKGNDWAGMFIATVIGLALAIIIINMLFGAEAVTYWIADRFSN